MQAEWLIIVVIFALGYTMGVLQGGIRISINQKPPEPPKTKEYNKSTEELLPPDVKQFYDNNQQFKF